MVSATPITAWLWPGVAASGGRDKHRGAGVRGRERAAAVGHGTDERRERKHARDVEGHHETDHLE
jgi:hypothetical protein